jgi:hypothetical protein
MIIVNINDIANKVRSAALTGLDTALTGAVVAADTVLEAFGKIQNQINGINTSLGNKLEAGDNVSSLTNDSGYVDSAGASGAAPIQTVSGTAVDNTDPANPVINSTGGGATNHSELVLDDGTNPHGTTKADVGLGNADNTSDADKPVSTAQQTALNLKADQTALNAHTGDATIHFTEGNISHSNIQDIGINTHAQIDSHIADVANPHSVTKTQVGLSNVDNTSDLNKPVSTAQQTALDGKVDKVAGKGLSDENYTLAEKDKLAGLESSKFLGEFVSLAALQTAHPTADVGSYANVDLGVGSDVVRYIWDNDDSKWVEQLGESAELTPAQIKADYESNPDTNAFTDADESNLDLNTTHRGRTDNPHSVTKSQVGLGNVDNTSDLDKPVSTAQQTALNLKADQTDLDNHTGDSTIHFTEGSINHANIQNVGTNTHAQIDSHIADAAKHREINDLGASITDLWSADKIGAELAGKANTGDVVTNHSGLTLDDGTNPHGTTKADVGLANVDNVQQYPNTNPSAFETPTELNARDTANRDRANHTGTQLASTISNFDTEVENNTQVSQNTTHRGLTNNPHSVTKAQVGLSKVDNDLQVKAADKALQADAEAGTNDTKWMTPLKTKQAIDQFASGAGEANTASNVGTGEGVFKTKSGVDLQFKTLKAGANITIDNTNPDELEISSSGGGGGIDAITTESAGANTTITTTNSAMHVLTMTGDLTATISDFNEAAKTHRFILKVVQDATGGRTLTIAGNVLFPGGIQPANSESTGAVDVYTFDWDGTNWLLVNKTSAYA